MVAPPRHTRPLDEELEAVDPIREPRLNEPAQPIDTRVLNPARADRFPGNLSRQRLPRPPAQDRRSTDAATSSATDALADRGSPAAALTPRDGRRPTGRRRRARARKKLAAIAEGRAGVRARGKRGPKRNCLEVGNRQRLTHPRGGCTPHELAGEAEVRLVTAGTGDDQWAGRESRGGPPAACR